MKVGIKLLYNYNKEWGLPKYQYDGDVGIDVFAAIKYGTTLRPGERKLIPTGISVNIPEGYEIQVRPRSGLALDDGITVLNSPGTIDQNFKNEIGIILINFNFSIENYYDDNGFSHEYLIPWSDYDISPGDRIAQIVLKKVEKIEWEVLENLSQSDRELKGFGSSGVK